MKRTNNRGEVEKVNVQLSASRGWNDVHSKRPTSVERFNNLTWKTEMLCCVEREVEIVIKWNGKFALTFVQCRAESSAARSTIPDVSSPPSCRCMSTVVDTLMSTCCHRRTLVRWGSSSTRNAASQMARLPHRTARVVSSTRREVQQRLSWTFFAVNNSLSILREEEDEVSRHPSEFIYSHSNEDLWSDWLFLFFSTSISSF